MITHLFSMSLNLLFYVYHMTSVEIKFIDIIIIIIILGGNLWLMHVITMITRGHVTPSTCGSWSVGRLVDGRSVGQSVGWLVCQSVGRLVGRLETM